MSPKVEWLAASVFRKTSYLSGAGRRGYGTRRASASSPGESSPRFVFSISGDLKYLAKLVIPEVNDFADKPGEYVNKRAIALHLTMINNAMEGLAGERTSVSWADPGLGALWGKINAESAKAYSALARGR